MASQPFSGTKVYYSGSIYGVQESDIHLPEKLVHYMQENGAQVLDEHVAIPHKGEIFHTAVALSQGFTLEEWFGIEEYQQALRIYEHDIRLVDESTHVVVLANGRSHGVGMEVQRALDKPHLGLTITPILVLVHEGFLPRLSFMLRGAAEKYEHMSICVYCSTEQAKEAMYEFLTR